MVLGDNASRLLVIFGIQKEKSFFAVRDKVVRCVVTVFGDKFARSVGCRCFLRVEGDLRLLMDSRRGDNAALAENLFYAIENTFLVGWA